ncbi:MAG: phosphatase domain-containing protein [Pirellulaceae bacterium]
MFLTGIITTGVLWLLLLGARCARPQDTGTPEITSRGQAAAAPSDISADEEVVFFTTAAHFDAPNNQWIVPIHGIIYELEADSAQRAFFASAIRRTANVPVGSPEAQRLDQRLRLFLVDNERGQRISIHLGQERYAVGISGPNGHFRAEVRMPATGQEASSPDRERADRFIAFSAVTRASDLRSFSGCAQLVSPRGFSIISDIDDTIKHTQVHDRRAMLANTFLKEFQAVPGMADLYRRWAQQGCVFHYVSGSPWQLYLPLVEFLRTQQFPEGSVNLKPFRLKDPSTANLLRSPRATKIRAIERLLTAFPQRRFVLIGDSGEQDPEIYAELARTYRQQIVAVFIRNVTAEQPDGERYRALEPALESVQFHLFERAEELTPLMEEIRRHADTGP